MRILIAPLNWGLGHASRCVPLIVRHLRAGDDVILAGDGDSLRVLRRRFPQLTYYQAASLVVNYSAGSSQVGAILRLLPRLLRFVIADHRALRTILSKEHIDLVISDNRFGFFSSSVRCVYLTHQLHICLPHHWRWAEPLAEHLHACVWRKYNEVWVPDDADHRLSGCLSILTSVRPPRTLRYIEPLSRFTYTSPIADIGVPYHMVAVLSGPEPQRTLFEERLFAQAMLSAERVLIVRGLAALPPMEIQKRTPNGGLVTLVPYLADSVLLAYLLAAHRIICRSGYSSIMDLDALRLWDKAELFPTPGQPEQEYLCRYHTK